MVSEEQLLQDIIDFIATLYPNKTLEIFDLAVVLGHGGAQFVQFPQKAGYLVSDERRQLSVIRSDNVVQLDKKYHAYYKSLGNEIGDQLLEPTALSQAVRDALNARKWPYLDLVEGLRGHKENLYIPNDDHLNANGQRAAGTRLYEYLRKQQIFR